MEKIFSKKDAYLAMFSFLEGYYRQTEDDGVGSLLSGMCLMDDGMPMDQAYWLDWERAVENALNHTVDAGVRFSGNPFIPTGDKK
jgi:hypothetical protein